MPKFIVKGGKELSGEVTVSGSKNAALPIICAALLSTEKSTLTNVPDIADTHSLVKILEGIGAKIEFSDNTLSIDPSQLNGDHFPNELVEKMRASILIIGALLPRLKEVKVAFPGGCVLDKRSVHAHTHAFKELGAEILDDTNELHVKADKLTGKKITLPESSVTATENAIMAAVLAEGDTEIRLAAVEPHVVDLCNFLEKMGAKISGIGTNNVKISGVQSLKGATHSITGDYLEAGTFALAAAATNSDLTINGINPDDLDSFFQKLTEVGIQYELSESSFKIITSDNKKNATDFKTAIHPGFPTDLQAPFAVLLTQCEGVSKVFETLFDGRLNYLFELEKMGLHYELMNPHQAIIIGPAKLRATPISSWDIRAGAAMVIAALIAEGTTEISDIKYTDRGYERFDEKLRSIGADIERA